MAAKKFEREMMAKVEALGGAEFVEDYIGDGGTVKSLSEEIGCSRTFLSRILNKRDEYKTALENGRRAQADRGCCSPINSC